MVRTLVSLALIARCRAVIPYLSTAFTSTFGSASAFSSRAGSFSYLRTAVMSALSLADASGWMLVASRHSGVSMGLPLASSG